MTTKFNSIDFPAARTNIANQLLSSDHEDEAVIIRQDVGHKQGASLFARFNRALEELWAPASLAMTYWLEDPSHR